MVWTKVRLGAALVACAAVVSFYGAAGAATLILSDDFNDNAIDGAKWTVRTDAYAGAAVAEANQRIEFASRGYLNTTQQYDPAAQAENGIRIRGQWTYVGGGDMMQVLTRTDGTPAGTYGETNAGVEFRAFGFSNGNAMTIHGKGGATVAGVSGNGNLNAANGETYNFEIRDDGTNLFYEMRQVGGTKHRTVTAQSTSAMGTNLITIHNREGGRNSNLDNVVIDSPSAWPAMADNFNDGAIDSNKWFVRTEGIPQNPKSAVETGGVMQLQGRAHLNTVDQFNPAAAPNEGLRVRGQWTFQSNDDLMQILTRSDGFPGGSYGETDNGVEFLVAGAGIGGNMSIGNRGGAAVAGVVNAGALNAQAGETYNFDIRDNGTNLVFTMTQVGGTKQRTVTAQSPSAMVSNRVTFHNREGGRRSDLDNVVIDSPQRAFAIPGPVLLQDNFNDNSLDGAKWNVVTAGIPQNPKSVQEVDARVRIEGRAHLNTAQQYNPAAGGLVVQGRWTYQSGDDVMQILTRSDGTPGGSYGETNNGVEFRAWQIGGQPRVGITGRGGAAVGNAIGANLNIAAGETYDFQVFDDGTNLSLFLKQVGGPKAAVATATSTSVLAQNLVTFHNREGGKLSHLDDVVIAQGAPSAGPGLLTAAGYHVTQVKAASGVTIGNLAQADALLAGTLASSATAHGSYDSINFWEDGGTGVIGNDVPFPLAGPQNDFALLALADLVVTQAGDYVFGFNGDDGARLRIDGVDVIVNDVNTGPHNVYGHIELAAGTHELEIVFFERSGGAEAELFFVDGTGQRRLTAVPEPATMALSALALAGLGGYIRRRRRA